MKIAIIGAGPIAIEASLYFLNQECSVTLFSGDLQSDLYFQSFAGINEFFETTATGRQILGLTNELLSLEEYQELYFYPLMEDLKQKGIVRPCRVNRISKAHLNSEEEITGRLRLADLFRVTFEMDAEKMIEEQMKLNEMAFNNISPATLSSLKRSIEMAEDFDIVIYAKENFEKNLPIGIGGNLCLNEKVFNQERRFYNRGFEKISKNVHTIALLGDVTGISKGLVNIQEWLSSAKNKKVYVLSAANNLYDLLGNTDSEGVNKTVKSILQSLERYHNNEEIRLETELKKWNALEDYVRVKFPKPQMVEPQINFIESTNVISIDQLDEQKKFFLTLEPAKKPGQFEEFLGVRTIGVDAILNMNPGKHFADLVEGLKIDYRDLKKDKIIFPEEPGFYHLKNFGIICDTKKFEEKFKLIINEIKKYFSKS